MFDTICHEHLEYYSSKVILNLCNKNKLRVFDIKKNDINGSSKQYYICHDNSKILNNNIVIKDELQNESKLKLSEVEKLKKFFKNINQLKNELIKLIKKIN